MKPIQPSPNAQQTSGNHLSFWLNNQAPLRYSKLAHDIETEVLVIGGGIAGLTTAYLLLKAGKNVSLVEDGDLGSGETGRTTAHLTAALDDRYYFLSETFGKDNARLAAESHTTAINTIASIIEAEQIDCHFHRVDGFLFSDPSDTHENLLKEFEATRDAGLDTHLHTDTPGITGGHPMTSICFSRQAQFHILKYLQGLAEAITKMGGKIYTGTKAENITKHGATANGFKINAQHIVVATNTPINDVVTMHTKQAAYRTYVIAAKIRKGALPYALWWDTGNTNSRWVSQPYHYVRLEEFDDEYDLLISGGEDHKTGQADEEHIPEQDRYYELEKWTRSHFPQLQEVAWFWSGQVMEPIDSLGFMGRNPGDDNIYIITGDSGNGMTHTTIGAMVITDLINGTKNPWEDLYSPSRITFKTAGDFIKETANMASQYLDWLSPADLKNAESLQPGEGGVFTSGISKRAAYCDADNKIHTFSAVCPHLGCIVKWNADEKSFDCPCHGSRFSHDGAVINGPSKKGLTRLHPEEES